MKGFVVLTITIPAYDDSYTLEHVKKDYGVDLSESQTYVKEIVTLGSNYLSTLVAA